MRRRHVLLLRFVLLWMLALPVAWAQGGPLVLGAEGRYNLGPHVNVLEDHEGDLDLAGILQPAQQARFHAVQGSGPSANFGMTRGAIWLRIVLQAPAGSDPDWLLELAYPPLDRLELFTRDAKGAWQRQVGGDQEPFTRRPMAHRNHVLPVRIAPGQATTLYLRLASEGVVAAPLRLWRPQALWHQDQLAYAALALYFGLLVGLLLYNLLLWVSARDLSFLLYVLFVASLGLAQGALTGLGSQFLWPGLVWWNGVVPHVGVALAGVFALLFARRFLESATSLPRMDRVLRVLAWLWALTAVAAAALPYVFSAWMLMVLSPVGIAALVATGVLAMRRGHGGARQYLAAWAVLLLGVFTLLLHNSGFIPSNAFTSNSLLLGSAVEMVLLSFALGDRINVAQRQREQANARLAAEQALVEALSDSQQKLQTALQERELILENSIVGICFLTGDGRLRWANRAMLEMFGAADGEQVESMEPFYLSREHYLEVGGEVIAAAARGEVYERELQVQRLDGTRLWIQLSGKAVGHDARNQGTVWIIRDISRRKDLEEQLQRTMREREAILNNAVVGIVLSVKRRHEWVNQKFADMLGYPRQVLTGQSSDYLHPDTQTWQRFGVEARATLIATNSYTCEMQLRRRTGELFWVEMGGSCVRPHDPDSGVIWTFLDITRRKHSEARMREALEQQQALNEMRSRFVAMTSHEFRTPLAAILSAGELLRHYGDRLPPEERDETLDGIAQGVQRMSRMLDRVLLLGRADAQMLEFKPARIDLRVLCPRLVDEAGLQHPGATSRVVCDVAPDLAPSLYDEKLLRHIFVNLLSNAIKYSPGGGEVRFEVRRDEDDTVFRVRDQGIGVPPAEMDHLFESFHRASNVGDIQGTGLGLAIVKNAVDMHGGTIAVESAVGEGTTFIVRLPGYLPARRGPVTAALPAGDRARPS
ncbi:PAS domain S-box protein [Ramlibacter sp. USB13]|uniref:histidine kinase n=1 Tax=Ramlibacter cellulosilyticus TaxID=2764187 RepID=A0A923MQD2_9BURK|nr:7TM diverse intracellular signaling domain-containing protein [Ramlibacter cellulosilyticus]MBC5783285.1 PAS domain S-box protein [Ramlibacter cellulosilyticus]